MFSSIIYLHMANWNKWTKLFTELLTLSIGSTHSLVLFIRFGGFTYWIYLLALFIRFGGFIYWVYLLALVSTYTVSIAISFKFSHSSERNTFTFLSLYISHILMDKIFCFPLHHHSGLIKLTLLQLHHHTSLIKLTNITSLHHIYYTCWLIKLTNITSLHHNYYTCSILNLHYFNIVSHYSVSTHLQIPSDIQFLHLPSIFISLARRCASYSISNYIWNSLKLLLLSGNAEINPGLQPIDRNPVFCTICSKKINWGPQQDMVPTCSNKNCNTCHQACNGLSIGQTCHVKDSGCSITWKCPEHGTGIAKIIIPYAVVYEQPNRPSAVGKSCSVSKNHIQTCYANLAYHCSNPSCSVCHLASMCSRFINPRENARASAYSIRVWHCHLHSSPSATSHPSLSPDNSPPCPTPPSLKSLLDWRLSWS